MAIRRPLNLHPRSNESAPDDVSRWPYPIAEQTVQVRRDGTIVIPASLAQMIAPELGDSVTLKVLSDGHLEADSDVGRSGPSRSTRAEARSAEDFIETLKREAEADRR
ncbi:MAG: hypothetical protein AB7J35_20610 [Dehalococcoidia bacterium]